MDERNILNNILVFLERVDLKWTEAQALAQAQGYLNWKMKALSMVQTPKQAPKSKSSEKVESK